ncbi:hypothetical protein Y032_0036g3205 [Ancylostoma ceylanicum]|uniref:Uncharacterized protein n=1 Tax=Ancylostoma ceylanicum TaxID=53326 RepID=A0A016UL53_9BILA|nr:hypothetical protein Y032_0036g3205 [Ancylostoma ceylanicum]
MSRLLSFIIGAAIVTGARGCSAGMGTDDYEWLEDPVFDMDISPPVAWTYFPAKVEFRQFLPILSSKR